jgi:hypothetical protein
MEGIMKLVWVTNDKRITAEDTILDISTKGTFGFNREFPPGKYIIGKPQGTKIKTSTELIQLGFVGIYYVEQ